MQLQKHAIAVHTFAIAPSHCNALTQTKMKRICNPVYICIFTVTICMIPLNTRYVAKMIDIMI